jgi:D-glycero-alpha-D-manno-heptose-7-phosphate kinase
MLEFGRDGSVRVTPIGMSDGAKRELAAHLMLFSNGGRRNSAGPLAELTRRISADDRETIRALEELKANALETRAALELGDVDGIGELLDRGWRAKRRLHSQISTPEIDRAVALAKRAGALGAKLTGAGLAGSLLVAAPPGRHGDIKIALGTQGWHPRGMAFDETGVTVGGASEGAVTG